MVSESRTLGSGAMPLLSSTSEQVRPSSKQFTSARRFRPSMAAVEISTRDLPQLAHVWKATGLTSEEPGSHVSFSSAYPHSKRCNRMSSVNLETV